MLLNNICEDVTQTSVTNMLQQQHVPVAPATTTLLHHPVTCTLSIHRVVQNGSPAMPAWYKDACWLRGELATEDTARSTQPPSPSSTALGATTGPEASCLALPHVRSPTQPVALSSARTPTTTAAQQASSPCRGRFEWSSSWSTSPAACGLRCSTSGVLEITTCSPMRTTSSLTTSAAALERSPSALFSAIVPSPPPPSPVVLSLVRSKGHPGSPRDGAESPPDEAPITDPRAKMAYWWFPAVFIVNCESPRRKAYIAVGRRADLQTDSPARATFGQARAPAVVRTPARRFCATRPCTLCLLDHVARAVRSFSRKARYLMASRNGGVGSAQ